MNKKFYAIIDTNVIVAALLTKNKLSATVRVLEAFLSGEVVAVAHEKIIDEYKAVLSREKFNFSKEKIEKVVAAFEQNSVFLSGATFDEPVSDPKDIVFYEVSLDAQSHFDDSYLVTGNIKDFPVKPFIVTPSQFLDILLENSGFTVNEPLVRYSV